MTFFDAKKLFHPFKSSMPLGAPCVLSHGTSLKLLQGNPEVETFGRELMAVGHELNHVYVVFFMVIG